VRTQDGTRLGGRVDVREVGAHALRADDVIQAAGTAHTPAVARARGQLHAGDRSTARTSLGTPGLSGCHQARTQAAPHRRGACAACQHDLGQHCSYAAVQQPASAWIVRTRNAAAPSQCVRTAQRRGGCCEDGAPQLADLGIGLQQECKGLPDPAGRPCPGFTAL